MKLNYKRINKLFLIMLIAISVTGLMACESFSSGMKESDQEVEETESDRGEQGISETDFMKNAAGEVVNALAELTADEAYIRTMSASEEIVDLAKQWQDAEVEKTEEIQVIPLYKETMQNLLEMTVDYEDLSETAKEYLQISFGKSASNIVNARAGVDVLAAAAVLNYSKSYAVDYDFENQIWVMPTDKDGVVICVSFVHTGEGVITVNSSYLISEENTSAADLMIQYLGIDEDAVEYVEW